MCAVAPDPIARVALPMAKWHRRTTAAGHGLGLGLAVVQAQVLCACGRVGACGHPQGQARWWISSATKRRTVKHEIRFWNCPGSPAVEKIVQTAKQPHLEQPLGGWQAGLVDDFKLTIKYPGGRPGDGGSAARNQSRVFTLAGKQVCRVSLLRVPASPRMSVYYCQSKGREQKAESRERPSRNVGRPCFPPAPLRCCRHGTPETSGA